MRLIPLRLFAVGILLVLGLSAPAHASDRAALARLQRIARGQWLPVVTPTVNVPFALEIRAAARRHGLSSSLLAALVRTESGFDPKAVSVAGAQGLGQLMPKTADALAVRDPFDPAQNLDGAALPRGPARELPEREARAGRLPRGTRTRRARTSVGADEHSFLHRARAALRAGVPRSRASLTERGDGA